MGGVMTRRNAGCAVDGGNGQAADTAARVAYGPHMPRIARSAPLLAAALAAAALPLTTAARAHAAVSRIVYTADTGPFRIYSVGADGKGRKRLTRGPFDNEPSFSPNRRAIVFSRAGRLFTMRADGSHLRRIPHTRLAGEPAWAPKGGRIAYSVTGKGGNVSAVYTIRPDGSGRKRLTPFDDFLGSPDWSPSSRSIVYSSDADGVSTMRADGSHKRLIVPDAQQPSWSPDGKRIAFSLNRRISTSRADGSDIQPVTALVPQACEGFEDGCGREDETPAWSPSGSSIAYGANIEGSDEGGVFVVKVGGKTARRVAKGGLTPDW
jgi:Tol biopolymer transport system component